MRVLHCQNCGKAGLAVFQATTPGRPTLMGNTLATALLHDQNWTVLLGLIARRRRGRLRTKSTTDTMHGDSTIMEDYRVMEWFLHYHFVSLETFERYHF